MPQPDIILSDASPDGNLEVLIDQDDRVAHLWLRAPNDESFGIKSCWVRNLRKAPEQLDVAAMRNGIAPMLPREYCRYPNGQPPLDAKRLEVVWFPDGDGVAVLEDGEMLASIPPWGGYKGFHGYARDCNGQGPLCWGLEDASSFRERIAAAQRYWAAWDADPGPWKVCQNAFLAAYEKALGPYTRYFAIDGNRWPPRSLIRVDKGDRVYLLTLGISLRPQPAVAMYAEDPAAYSRIELGACFSSAVPEELIMSFASYLSGQSDFPWQRFTFLAHGHTIGCDVFTADASLREFTAALLVKNPPGAPEFELPAMGGNEVSLLWMIPITPAERRVAEEEGSKALLAMMDESSPHIIGERKPSRV